MKTKHLIAVDRSGAEEVLKYCKESQIKLQNYQ